MWWDCSCFHSWYRCEVIVKDNMVLWADMSSGWVVDKCNASSVKRRVSKIYTNIWYWFPFWQSNWTRIVESTVQNVTWTEHCVKGFYWYVFNVNSIELDSGVWPSVSMWRLFILSAAAFIANGQNIWSTIWGHILMLCNKRTLAVWVSCLFLFLTIPFQWCAPTLQNSMVWLRLLKAAGNSVSENWPLSDW